MYAGKVYLYLINVVILQSVPKFCFQHFFLKISIIIISTFGPKLHSYTRMKKSLKRSLKRQRF